MYLELFKLINWFNSSYYICSLFYEKYSGSIWQLVHMPVSNWRLLGVLILNVKLASQL